MKYSCAVMALLGSVTADGTDFLYAETRNSASSSEERVFTEPMTPTGSNTQQTIEVE